MELIRNVLTARTKYFDPKKDITFVKLGEELSHMMQEADIYDRDIVFVCIGTDRATGDALGPLVGDMLESIADSSVFGTLREPVHALNIRDTIEHIYDSWNDPFVIAIDASLGLTKDIGYVTVSNSHIYPGKGVNKKLPAIGDISLTGIVNASGRSGSNLLQTTRLYTVKTMADCIYKAIVYAFNYLSLPL